ncbi:MAG: ATP-binding protein [Bacteroidales bacterium]|nr:ATP-binding protein [Bacteroidales bacterium]
MALRYPIGIQWFPNLRERGYAYVDKTEIIYRLTHTFDACFLSRPRRFGKSLLLSTMEAYFKGERELFQGLAIEKLEKGWVKHPVIHIDLNNGTFTSVEMVEKSINEELNRLDRIYGIDTKGDTLGARFEAAITRAYQLGGRGVVVLIDEYDKPMLDIIGDEKTQDAYREVLKPFYGTLKKNEKYLRFIFITGVTKFAKLSVFSDLNQLKDISLLPDYDTICGITPEEMLTYFLSGVEEFARAKGWSLDELVKKLEEKYDGYHFSAAMRGVLNPFSLINALCDKSLNDYWIQTGTPTSLVKFMQTRHTPVDELEGYRATGGMLMSVETTKANPIPVIYQTGYLTIKAYDEATQMYTLGFPNDEVEQGFLNYLLPNYANVPNANSGLEILEFVADLRTGNAQGFLRRIQALFANVNFELVLNAEAHYKNVLFIVFKLLGLYVHVERHTSQGSIDMVIETEKYVYIIEFKYNGTAKKALEQIIETGYAMPYQCDSRTVILVAASFSSRTRTLSSRWIIQEYKPA